MSMIGYQTLHCPVCDKTHVIQVGELVWKDGGGSSWRPVGYYCFYCQKPFNVEGAIKTIRSKELEEKIKELKANG